MIGVTTATIIILLSGGGEVEHSLTGLKKPVKKNIDDKGRQKLILDESKALSKDLKSLGKEIDGHVENFVKVHADFYSTGADFDFVTEQLVADQKQATKRILDARDVMHEQMTRDEWNAVFQSTEK